MFRTAVAGAGVADLVSAYLMEDRESNTVGMWRFESDQMRMGIPFFEDPYRYLMNSPVTHAAAIQTPLLQFAGQDDLQVNPSQSMEFHLALRRLKKENLLLLYPGEGHVFIKKDSQRYLSLKISGWFAHYLKGGPKPTWMEPR